VGRSATALSWGDTGQSSVAAISVVVNFVAIELSFQIALVPKQSMIEVFAPDGPDQSLDEGVRTRCPGNRLDLINLKYSKVRQPAPIAAFLAAPVSPALSAFAFPAALIASPGGIEIIFWSCSLIAKI
jgi:hypothetical protein